MISMVAKLLSSRNKCSRFTRLAVVLIFVACVACERTNTIHSPVLRNAVELFYIENENDSILYLLSSFEPSNNRDSNLKNILTAAALCENGKVDSAFSIISSLEPIRNDHILSFWHMHIKGLILFRKSGFTQEAYETLLQAVSGKRYDIRACALSERLIARILFTYGNNREGVEWMVKSSEHFRQAGLEKSIGINKKVLGRYYMGVGNRAEAFRNFKESEEILTKYNDIPELYYIYVNLIDYYIQGNELEQAAEYVETCLTILENWNDNQMNVMMYNNLGEIKLMQDEHDAAETYFRQTINIPMDYVNAHVRVGRAWMFLSQIYQEKGNEDQALEYAYHAIRHLGGSNCPNHYKHLVYSQLADLYSKHPDKKAYGMYRDSVETYRQAISEEKITLSKDVYDIKTQLLQSAYDMDQVKTRAKNQVLILASALLVLLVIAVTFAILHRVVKSKARVMRSLAQKNMQLAEEERRKMREIKESLIHSNNHSSCKQIGKDKTGELYAQVVGWLQEEDNFKSKNLTLDIVSNELNTNRQYISQAINANGINFNELVNRFRINEAINILTDTKHEMNRQKIIVIASAVGFNSESVFFDAFKKQTGMTPLQFRNRKS